MQNVWYAVSVIGIHNRRRMPLMKKTCRLKIIFIFFSLFFFCLRRTCMWTWTMGTRSSNMSMRLYKSREIKTKREAHTITPYPRVLTLLLIYGSRLLYSNSHLFFILFMITIDLFWCRFSGQIVHTHTHTSRYFILNLIFHYIFHTISFENEFIRSSVAEYQLIEFIFFHQRPWQRQVPLW